MPERFFFSKKNQTPSLFTTDDTLTSCKQSEKRKNSRLPDKRTEGIL